MKLYYLKAGEMYLQNIYIDKQCYITDFINNLDFTCEKDCALAFKLEEAEVIKNKLYIISGIYTEIVEATENETI